jgi:uncharacterized protein (DUF1501 family)
MKRRDFIKLSLLSAGAFGLSVYSDPLFAMAGNPRKKLVFIFLKGGADVLSMFPPVIKSAYRDNIDNCEKYNDHLKIHPSLGLSEDLIKNLMIFTHTGVMGVKSSRSHFVQIEQIEKGYGKDGYFARKLESLKGVAIGSNVPKSFMGADVPLISNLSDIKTGFDLGKVSMARSERLGLFRTRTNNVLNTLVPQAIDDYDKIERGFYDEKSTGSEFEDYCKTAAALTKPPKDGEFEPSIITIDFGGWDDHINLDPNNSSSSFSKRLSTLNNGLIALNDGMSSETIVVVMSEFGRTIRINPSKGADHGVGSAMMVFGKQVNTLFKGHKFSQSWDFSSTDNGLAGASSEAFAVKNDCFEVLDKIIDGHVKKAA